MQVVAIGSITVDIVVSGMPAQLTLGDKQEVGTIQSYPGGGALNATACFIAHGESVRLLGAVGSDELGSRLCAHIEHLGVDTRSVQVCQGQSTGQAIVLVEPSGSASVLAQRGANAALRIQSTDLTAQLVYVAPLGAQALQSLAHALEQGQCSFQCLVVNPSVASVRQPSAAFERVRAQADVVGLNAVEAQMLAGVKDRDIDVDLAVAQAGDLAMRLQAHARQAVVITLGVQGAVLAFNGQRYFEPACRVAVRSTVGAGDAFHAQFALAWSRRQEPEKALQQASRAAADRLGQWAANSFPPLFAQDLGQSLAL